MLGFNRAATSASSATIAATTPATAFNIRVPQLHTIRTRTNYCFSQQQSSTTTTTYRVIVHPVKAMAETVAAPHSSSKFSTFGRKQALISLSDKTDLSKLGNGLQELGYTIVSTGGTASALEGAGVSVAKVEELTRFPEMVGTPDQRLKGITGIRLGMRQSLNTPRRP